MSNVSQEKWSRIVDEIGKCRKCHKSSDPVVDDNAFPLFMKTPPLKSQILKEGDVGSETTYFLKA
jgi:hypothetical protein